MSDFAEKLEKACIKTIEDGKMTKDLALITTNPNPVVLNSEDFIKAIRTTLEGKFKMILSCQSISKSFGTDEILKDVSFHIEANEKAAIVGINGAGKSTLLKIIMGEETSDAGEVILAKDKTIGYLAQYQDVSGHRTIYDEVLYARTDILEMEQKLRDMESEMNSRTGEELEKLMDIYHRQSHEFELQGRICIPQ